jgi:hypothetical protein
MNKRKSDDHEWRVICSLLPDGWRHQARPTGAIQRSRGALASPSALLRLLLFHAASDGSLRSTVAEAAELGLGQVSDVALLKRMRSSLAWLRWMATALASSMRESLPTVRGYRPRAIDSTTIQGPASRGTEWRLHYTLDLLSLCCDWHELTDEHGSELLERAPVRDGDVLLADRNFLRPQGVRAVKAGGGELIVRLRWQHPRLQDARGRRLFALHLARHLKVGEVGSWPAALDDPGEEPQTHGGRVIALKLPAPIARRKRQQVRRAASKKGRAPQPKSLEAAGYVLLWTTLPAKHFAPGVVLEWYRFRWQVELAFKRYKQLLRLGRLPHQDEEAAQGWIQAKLLLALLLETMYRNAAAVSPWGYHLGRRRPTEPLALDAPGAALGAAGDRARDAAVAAVAENRAGKAGAARAAQKAPRAG